MRRVITEKDLQVLIKGNGKAGHTRTAVLPKSPPVPPGASPDPFNFNSLPPPLPNTLPTNASNPVAEVPVADNYLSAVAKLVPGEIIAAFLSVNGLIKSGGVPPDPKAMSTGAYFIIAALFLVLTPIYLVRVMGDKRLPIPWLQVVVSTVSFGVWVFAIGGPFDRIHGLSTSLWPPIVVAVYTFLVPVVVTNR